MILETIEFLEILVDIIAAILFFMQPIAAPLGEIMVMAINNALGYFPAENLILYISIFIIIVVLGVIINTSPIGDKLKEKFNKYDEKHFKKYSKHIPESSEDAFQTIDKKKDKSQEDRSDVGKKDKEKKMIEKLDDMKTDNILKDKVKKNKIKADKQEKNIDVEKTSDAGENGKNNVEEESIDKAEVEENH